MAEGSSKKYYDGEHFRYLKGYEVYIPGQFSDVHPCFGAPKGEQWRFRHLKELYNSTGEYIAIPVYYLSHMTHQEAAKKITKADHYEFKPKAKMAKSKTDSSLAYGESYRKIIYKEEYRKLTDRCLVLRGGYSWWRINTQWWYMHSKSGSKLKKFIEDYSKGDGIIPSFTVPEFLASPPESDYGDKAFTIEFSNLLTCYKKSRTDRPHDSSIYLKVGGTLRYKCEICYVVIVCMENDETWRPKINIKDQNVFDLNGLVDDAGRVDLDQLDESVPDFKVKHIICTLSRSCDEVTKKGSSWEQLVFALYFPDETKSLCCPKELVSVESVAHMPKDCRSKIKKRI